MLRFWALLCLCIIVCVPVTGQTTPFLDDYRLRVPTAEEYAKGLTEVLALPHIDGKYVWYLESPPLMGMIWKELHLRFRFPDDFKFDWLLTIYSKLLRWFPDETNIALIQAWLLQTPIDLDDYNLLRPLRFWDYHIGVIPRDFNADGQHEWILQVNKQDGNYRRYLVVRQTENNTYQIVETPLPPLDCCDVYTTGTYVLSQIDELRFEDFNNNGLPEWILVSSDSGHYQYANLHILEWENNQLHWLNPYIAYRSPDGVERYRFPFDIFEFADINSDGTTDIIRSVKSGDNWGCTWTEQSVFSWDGNEYSRMSHERLYNAVQGCEFRRAEQAMWQHDYAQAIEHYTVLHTGIHFAFGNLQDVKQYVLLRLALAYSLTKQRENAIATLSQLQQENITSQAIQILFETMWANYVVSETNAFEVCKAVYQVFVEIVPCDHCFYDIPIDAFVGMLIENNATRIYPPYPDIAGCDLEQFIETPYPMMPYNSFYHPQTELPREVSLFDVEQVFRAGDYARVLELTDQLPETIREVAEKDFMVRYYRAMALEILHRPNDALAEYVMIFKAAAPGSAWGRLAALHLIPTTDY